MSQQQSPLEQYFSLSQTQGSFSSQATNLLANRPSQNTLYSNRLPSPNIKGSSSAINNGSSKRNVAQLMDIFNGKPKGSSQSGSQKEALSPSSFFISMTNPLNNPFTSSISAAPSSSTHTESSLRTSSQNNNVVNGVNSVVPSMTNPIQNNLDNFLTKSKSSLSLASTIDKEWLNLKFQNLEEKVTGMQQKHTELQEEVSTMMINLLKKMENIESVLEKHQFMMEEQYSLLSDKVVEMNHDVSMNFGDVKKATVESSQIISKSVQDCEHKMEEIKAQLITLESNTQSIIATRSFPSSTTAEVTVTPAAEAVELQVVATVISPLPSPQEAVPAKIVPKNVEELPPSSPLSKSPVKIDKQCKTKKSSQKVLQNFLNDKTTAAVQLLLKPRKQEPILIDDSWFCDEL